MRYCGICGVELFASSIKAGRCLACGAILSPLGDIPASDERNLTLNTVSEMNTSYQPLIESYPSATASTLPDRQPESARRTKRLLIVGIAGGFAILGVLILVVMVLFSGDPAKLGLQASHTSTPLQTTPGITPITSATAFAGNTSTPTTAPDGTVTQGTETVMPTSVATGTGTILPSPTSTTVPNPPILTVFPTSIQVVCVLGSTQVTISNTGGGVMNWTGSSSNGLYTLSPKSGVVNANQSQIVSIGGITLGGTLTFVDPNAQGSPQTVDVTCG